MQPRAALDALTSWRAREDIGNSDTPLVAVDLRDPVANDDVGHEDRARLQRALLDAPWVNVALVDARIGGAAAMIADACDVVLGVASEAPTAVDAQDPAELAASLDRLRSCVAASPHASVALVQLLRVSAEASIPAALHLESLSYATLQSSPTYVEWLAGRTPAPTAPEGPVVRVDREQSLLRITLDRPHKRNAVNVAMRDQLIEALTLLDLDRTLDGAVLDGSGPTFSAGGDLDEFGSTPSATIGHHVRMVRSLPGAVANVADRLRVHLHGRCVGAGIELSAFAHAVVAHPGATFRLPEVGFGLVPGAGGTVSITRRVGRHRSAWMALTGHEVDARTALAWGLVDRLDDAVAPPA